MHENDSLPTDITPILLWDIDNTIVNSKSQLNYPLLKTFLRHTLNCMTLLTSYDIRYRLKVSIEKNVARMDIIRRVSQEGFSIAATVASASPYFEEGSKLGQYYRESILPLELKAKEHYLLNGPSILSNLLSLIKADDFAAKEIATLESCINQSLVSNIPVWQEPEYKNGKQHLLVHTLLSYIAKGHRHFIILDDKPEVLNVVRRMQKEKILGEGVYLYAFAVNFSEVVQETEQEYEERLKEAYRCLGLTLPQAIELPVKRRCLCVDFSESVGSQAERKQPERLDAYQLAMYQQINYFDHHEKKSPRFTQQFISLLPAESERILYNPSHSLNKIISWIEYMVKEALTEKKEASAVEWDYHYLGLPDERFLERLSLGFSGEERLIKIITGYRCLRVIYNALETIEKPTIDFQALGKGRSYYKQVEIYRQLIKSPQHLLLKLALLETWINQDNKVKTFLEPTLANSHFNLSHEWIKELLTIELPGENFASIQEMSSHIAKQIAEKKPIEVIINAWYTLYHFNKESVNVSITSISKEKDAKGFSKQPFMSSST